MDLRDEQTSRSIYNTTLADGSPQIGAGEHEAKSGAEDGREARRDASEGLTLGRRRRGEREAGPGGGSDLSEARREGGRT